MAYAGNSKDGGNNEDKCNRKRKIPYYTKSYLEQIELLKKSHIERALDKLYEMNQTLASSYINGRQHTADELKKYKKWFKAICEELGESTTKDLDELRSCIEKIKKENDQYLDVLVVISKQIVDHNHMFKQLEHGIQSIYNVYICDIHKRIMESNDMIAANKLQMSLLETDIDELRKENMGLKKQNLEFNKRLKALEAK